jgi:hypothetical protein
MMRIRSAGCTKSVLFRRTFLSASIRSRISSASRKNSFRSELAKLSHYSRRRGRSNLVPGTRRKFSPIAFMQPKAVREEAWRAC